VSVSLSYSAAFLRQLKRLRKKYPSIAEDVRPLLLELQTGKTPGDRIRGAGHTVFKVRVPNRDAQRGARGGYRVIYYVPTLTARLLLAIYSKTEQADLAADDILRIVEETLGS
jgi:mRNA-degrading endonuclease RelE of RelBE toxin-antitoxin system